MNILIVSPKYHPVIGGGETFILNKVQRLYDAGHTVSVAVAPEEGRVLDDFSYSIYEIFGLSDSNMDIIEATKNLSSLIKRINPDIIHVHGYFALLVIGFCNTNDIPIISSIHSTPVWGKRIVGGMGSFDVELKFARKALESGKPHIVTAANNVYAEAAEKIVQGKYPVMILPYPVDTDKFYKVDAIDLRIQLGLKASDVLITVPSRIIKRKGIKEAIEALTKLPKQFFLFLPAAYDPLDKIYWQTITDSDAYKSVSNRIIIPENKITYDDMPNVYGATDIIAMPSYYEGAPVATVEAMASEKPFVGADSQGINGFIIDGENGLLVPQRSSEYLAEAIEKIYNNKELAEKISKKARNDIYWLSWDEQFKYLTALYESVIGKKELQTTQKGL